MKLYTEQQVRIAIGAGMSIGYSNQFNFDNIIDEYNKVVELTPSIELPSDEEIEKKAYSWCIVEPDENGFIRCGDDYSSRELPAFIASAKWVLDKIKNQQ